ncbi:Leucine rich repeat-containing protein [Prevotella sp. khp1]|uniref:leucine-rich repeat protein n=1 Tax=Prevotellaceae TaxID=171552 RepID=UPI0008819990|nr:MULTISPECIES: leucine-rich repeat protein [Prevotellaceae]QVJ81642.1 leucine-rich repeat protein [Xylanibacter ruminicola]SDQ56135.1 Leucine rich repeat-containing protein [Prevotella sp. khp1]
MQKKVLFLLLALMMGAAVQAQEIEKVDKFPSGYINGVYMGEAKYKTIDGVLYAVGYEGTKDWILVRYPAGSRNDTYTVHPYCRRIARGAFEGAAYLREIYLPETVSYIGDNAFAGCTSLTGIYFGDSEPSAVRSADTSSSGEAYEIARYNLSGRPCKPTDKGVQIIVYSDYTTQTIIIN